MFEHFQVLFVVDIILEMKKQVEMILFEYLQKLNIE
jgi:hypothetical protein